MIHTRSIAGLLALCLPGTAAFAVSAPAFPFDDYVRPYVNSGNFSGAVLVAKDGSVLYQSAYGPADQAARHRNTAATRFHLASLSMQFTSAAALRLIDAGKLALDTRVADVVPGLPNGEKITVRELLEETSGLPDVNSLPDYAQVLQAHQSAASLVEMILGKAPRFEPGSPSNGEEHSAFNLLALIVEKKTALPFAAAVRELVFKPLAMTRSGIDDDARLPADCAQGYAPVGARGIEPATKIKWSAKTGNASAYSTVGDELKWVHALFSGMFLSDSSRAAALDYSKAHVGYGWFKSSSKRFGVPVYYMNGRAPGFASYLLYVPSEKLSVVVLSNIYSSAPTAIGEDLAAMALGKPYEPVRLLAAPLPNAATAALSGSYKFGPDFYQPNATLQLTVDNGDATLHWPSAETTALIPLDNNHFVDRSYWVPVSIRKNPNGQVATLVYGGFSGQRL
ncbi:MAG TPA: serine hydrolase domain-containing protein [Steroidobacteraceae bacterium]